MADRTQIANLALTKLGEDPVTDIDEDVQAARILRANWATTRDLLLRQHPWNFAIREAALTPMVDRAGIEDALGHGTRYRYALPADFIRLLPHADAGDFTLAGGGVVMPGIAARAFRYVAAVEETGLWDPLFVECFALRLAATVAYKLTGDAQKEAPLMQAFELELRKAKAIDGRENPAEPSLATGWELARYGGGGYAGEGWWR